MEQSGVLSAQALTQWKMETGALKVPVLPQYVIFCPQHVVPSKWQSIRLKKISGIIGSHTCIDQTAGIYLSTGWGIGGPALVAICEEFYALGVRNFILVGMTGRLTSAISEGEALCASSAYREEGTSSHYISDKNSKMIDCPGETLLKNLEPVGLRKERFVSTDAPFRETPNKLTEWIGMRCSIVDMETASLYAFAKFYGTEAISVGIGSDALTDEQWIRPSNYGFLKSVAKKVTFQIVDLLK